MFSLYHQYTITCIVVARLSVYVAATVVVIRVIIIIVMMGMVVAVVVKMMNDDDEVLTVTHASLIFLIY